jgi:predicted RNA-binding protein with PIN domain
MSLFNKWVNSWLPGATGGPAPSKRRYIVDPAPRLPGKEKREKLTPAEQVKFLQRLSRFVRKEGLEVVAVFATKELRAVQHRGDFQGIQVCFEPDLEGFNQMVADLVRDQSQHARVTVITEDEPLERAVVGMGADAMRLGTFAKALEGSGDSRGENGGGGASRSARPHRRPRGRRRGRGDDESPRISRQGGSDTAAVRDLIDLVD